MFQLFTTPPSTGVFLARLGLALLLLWHAVNALLLPPEFDWDTLSILHQLHVAFSISSLIFGVLLLVGLMTRLAASAMLGVQTYSLFTLEPAPSLLLIEAHTALGLICLLLVFTGGGLFSVDRRLAKRFLP